MDKFPFSSGVGTVSFTENLSNSFESVITNIKGIKQALEISNSANKLRNEAWPE